MSDPMPVVRGRKLRGSSLVIALILVVGACSSSSTPVPAAASAPGTASAATAAPASQAASAATSPSSAPTAPPGGGTGTTEKWCALVIAINTKYGYMKDKTYSATPPTPDVWRQIITESLDHVDEWVAATPPEIMDATQAEIAWFQALKAYGDVHGWTSVTGFPQITTAQATAMAVLNPYQKTHCGIKFGG